MVSEVKEAPWLVLRTRSRHESAVEQTLRQKQIRAYLPKRKVVRRSRGQKRVVELHLHYYLLAEIVAELARSVKHRPPIDTAHREPLQEAVAALQAALEKRKG